MLKSFINHKKLSNENCNNFYINNTCDASLNHIICYYSKKNTTHNNISMKKCNNKNTDFYGTCFCCGYDNLVYMNIRHCNTLIVKYLTSKTIYNKYSKKHQLWHLKYTLKEHIYNNFPSIYNCDL